MNNNKIIISLPLLLAALLSAASIITPMIVAYGQDFLIGSPDDPVLTQEESEAQMQRELEVE